MEAHNHASPIFLILHGPGPTPSFRRTAGGTEICACAVMMRDGANAVVFTVPR